MTPQRYADTFVTRPRKVYDVYDEVTLNDDFIERVDFSFRHSLQKWWTQDPQTDLTDTGFQTESLLSIQKMLIGNAELAFLRQSRRTRRTCDVSTMTFLFCVVMSGLWVSGWVSANRLSYSVNSLWFFNFDKILLIRKSNRRIKLNYRGKWWTYIATGTLMQLQCGCNWPNSPPDVADSGATAEVVSTITRWSVVRYFDVTSSHAEIPNKEWMNWNDAKTRSLASFQRIRFSLGVCYISRSNVVSRSCEYLPFSFNMFSFHPSFRLSISIRKIPIVHFFKKKDKGCKNNSPRLVFSNR